MQRSAFFVFLLLFTTYLFGQEAAQESNEVFAPFVSRFKAKTGDSSIQLTWRDSEDIDGSVLIHRHAEEINENNLDSAELLARVEYGIESYTDFPQDIEPYYYSAIYESDSGHIYKIFIPL